MSRHTHTYVTLEISAAGYDEIAKKLRDADYGHCFNAAGEIDMSGIAVIRAPESPGSRRTVQGFVPPGTPDCKIVEYSLCANPKCDRVACTDSAPGYSEFCCVPCSIGAPHSRGCDIAIVAIRARLVVKHVPGPVCIHPMGQTTCGYTEENHHRADGSPMNHEFTALARTGQATEHHTEGSAKP
jgi:hypothetical protein